MLATSDELAAAEGLRREAVEIAAQTDALDLQADTPVDLSEVLETARPAGLSASAFSASSATEQK